jgi:hypothetical protein
LRGYTKTRRTSAIICGSLKKKRHIEVVGQRERGELKPTGTVSVRFVYEDCENSSIMGFYIWEMRKKKRK